MIKGTKSALEAASMLVDYAVKNGSRDNTSVLVLNFFE